MECGGVLTDPFGVITSPNFPSNYRSNERCTWVINAPEGSRINVNFTDFALEVHSNCTYDYLELFNGPTASFPKIGKFCGTAPPMGFKSQLNSVLIVFSTDDGVTRRGFRMTYKQDCPLGSYSVNCSKQCHCRVDSCDSITGACGNGGCKDEWTGIACNEKCGGILTHQFGVITSPNFPSNYSNKVNCTWFINAPEGYRIDVNFTYLALEHHSKCEFDYLKLFNGPNTSSPSIGMYCGTWTAPPSGFISQTNSVGIVFITDPLDTHKGFRMIYTFTQAAQCDGVTGSCDNGVCKEGLTGKACSERCPLGSYSVYCSKQCHCLEGPCDGATGACGHGGCLYGWAGKTCNEKCGGVLTDPSGVIQSPNFPSNYSNELECTWVINAPEGSRINVNFTDFVLEYHSSVNMTTCSYSTDLTPRLRPSESTAEKRHLGNSFHCRTLSVLSSSQTNLQLIRVSK